MSLHALQDLFRRHREKATGIWKLGEDPARTVYLDAGDIVFAHSTHALDRLTHLMVERGKLTQAQLDYALANLKPGLSIGKNLIDMGFITQRDLLETARAQVERVVAGAMGTADEAPHFDARELDATVVRLPFDTPLLLLQSTLGLKDREGILELLGPLNQVVLLQGRRLQELSLPPDLAKLPPLLDGTHTLLELSREAGAEPMRLGAFALFLREMGWARLHEMPPVDRNALDLALAPEPEALAGPLPDPPLDTMPTLFASIQDAARPTTNLEHLSQALDDLSESEPVDEGGFAVETGQAILPTPSFELPELPEAPAEDLPDGIRIQPATLGAEPVALPPLLEEALPSSNRRTWVLAGVLGLGLLGLGGWYSLKALRNDAGTRVPGPAPVAPDPAPDRAPSEAASPEPGAALAGPPSPEPAPKSEPKPDPKHESKPPSFAFAAADRCQALRKGDMVLAVQQGQRVRGGLKLGTWTLRLEIACQTETLRKAVGFFSEQNPDLWVLPLALRDGRGCYQLFLGAYDSRAAAERRIASLPGVFKAGGNRPRPFRLDELSEQQ